jgi:UDP-3-O-[3-hydroxymyristoyl] glucosamine N-acyltransferase
MRHSVRIHPTADVSDKAQIGQTCIFGKGVYVEFGVRLDLPRC